MHTTDVKGTSDKIVDSCRKAGVQPVYQQKSTLMGLLTRVKGPQKHMDKGVVYQIPVHSVMRSTLVKLEDH